MTTTTGRGTSAGVDKFAGRRRMLAESALTVIAQRGYAQTGMRDIAHQAGLSHGSLHYYFRDKDDLVALAVWDYKSECARRYDEILVAARSSEELASGFADEMAATLRDEASLHRLWYDLRNQSLFSEGFRDTIVAIDRLLQDMVWAVVVRYARFEGREPAISPELAYALFDGMFQNSLIRYFRGDVAAVEDVRRSAPALLRGALSSPRDS